MNIKPIPEHEAAKILLTLSRRIIYETSEHGNLEAILKGENWDYNIRQRSFFISLKQTKVYFFINEETKMWYYEVLYGSVYLNNTFLNVKRVFIPNESFLRIENVTFSFFYPNKHKKQQKSYQKLILQAINSSDEKRMTLSQIYAYFISHYGYSEKDSTTWKNSIRHNLSLNKMFMKTPRNQPGKIGKGMYWCINQEALVEKRIKANLSLYHFEKINSTLNLDAEKNTLDKLPISSTTYYDKNQSIDKNEKPLFFTNEPNSHEIRSDILKSYETQDPKAVQLIKRIYDKPPCHFAKKNGSYFNTHQTLFKNIHSNSNLFLTHKQLLPISDLYPSNKNYLTVSSSIQPKSTSNVDFLIHTGQTPELNLKRNKTQFNFYQRNTSHRVLDRFNKSTKISSLIDGSCKYAPHTLPYLSKRMCPEKSIDSIHKKPDITLSSTNPCSLSLVKKRISRLQEAVSICRPQLTFDRNLLHGTTIMQKNSESLCNVNPTTFLQAKENSRTNFVSYENGEYKPQHISKKIYPNCDPDQIDNLKVHISPPIISHPILVQETTAEFISERYTCNLGCHNYNIESYVKTKISNIKIKKTIYILQALKSWMGTRLEDFAESLSRKLNLPLFQQYLKYFDLIDPLLIHSKKIPSSKSSKLTNKKTFRRFSEHTIPKQREFFAEESQVYRTLPGKHYYSHDSYEKMRYTNNKAVIKCFPIQELQNLKNLFFVHAFLQKLSKKLIESTLESASLVSEIGTSTNIFNITTNQSSLGKIITPIALAKQKSPNKT